MNYFPEGYSVSLIIAFKNPAGEIEVPTAISARLLNGEGQEVHDLGAISFDTEAQDVTITIDGTLNILPVGEQRAVKILSVSLTLAGGTIQKNLSYVVEGSVQLSTMNGSFQTFENANFVASEMPDLPGWVGADERQKCFALSESFIRISKLPLKISSSNNVIEKVLWGAKWDSVSESDFFQFPETTRATLRRAQVIEANEILLGDITAKRRRLGIVEEEIGESRVKLDRPGIDYGICDATLRELTGLLSTTAYIARV